MASSQDRYDIMNMGGITLHGRLGLAFRGEDFSLMMNCGFGNDDGGMEDGVHTVHR